MKLKLSISRKVGIGAPVYGSDGASAEIEVEIDGTPAAIAAGAPIWYTALEQAVGAELARLQAAHPQPRPVTGPGPAPRHSECPPSRRPEPGWDDQPPPAESRRQNGREQSQENTSRDNPPRTGPELAGWMMKNDGRKKAIEDWGRSRNMPWRVKTWTDDAAQACYHDVTARALAET